ncbi:polysaccharide chain length determinant protein [Geobacter sp. SVR]|nr:polysaccharide chain length determinant protein [Geobacter sp. SVR]GCF85180.1 polysaccharide chain length determinant protein [Geobacter sp. SVR]
MILLTSLGAALLTALITLFMPNIYTATTLILASEDDKAGMSAMMAQLGGLAGLAGGSLGGPTKTDLYVSMLRSEAVKDPIIDRYKLLDVYKAKFRVDAYKTLDTKAMISAGKKDGIITIAVNDKDPKRAADMANGYVEELGKLAVRLSMSGAGKNRLFLEERLTTAKADLTRAEDELKAFQSRNKMVNVTEQAKASIEGVAQLRAQLAVQEVQLAALQRQFTDSSQEVKRARTSVENMKRQIARLEGSGGNSSIPSVGSVPQLGQDYLRLMREFKIQETMVELLTKQYEMARLSESKDLSPFQVLQKAKVPEKKSKPARSKLVIVATFVTFFFSVLFAFAREGFARMPEKELERWKSLRSPRR